MATSTTKEMAMAKFEVRWVIDVEDVDSPRRAAEEAWETMRHPDSTADVFQVTDEAGNVTVVDLDAPE